MMDFLEYFLHTDPKTSDQRLKLVAFKASQECQTILTNLVSQIKEEAVQFFTIKVGDRVVLTKEQQSRLFTESYTYLPTNKRLAKIQQRIMFLLRPIKKEMQIQNLREVELETEFEGESSWTMAREAVRRTNAELTPLILKLDQQLKVDSLTWYRRLWQDQELWTKVANGVPFPQGGDKSLATLDRGFVAFEDLAPLLYLKGELEGYPIQRDIRHIVIDEVQDYAPLQLEILNKTFPRAKFTLVGDIYQSLNPYIWQKEQRDLDTVFTGLKPTTVQLTKSYRSTQEIFHFCNGILENKSTAETVIRTGPKPKLIKVTAEQGPLTLHQQVKEYLRAGHETIAIICPSLAQCKDYFAGLRSLDDELNLALLDNEKATFRSGVVILPVYLAKGLEFDAVILPEVNAETYGQEYLRRLLYVACSRALHELSLLYTNELSPFLRDLPPYLYETIK